MRFFTWKVILDRRDVALGEVTSLLIRCICQVDITTLRDSPGLGPEAARQGAGHVGGARQRLESRSGAKSRIA